MLRQVTSIIYKTQNCAQSRSFWVVVKLHKSSTLNIILYDITYSTYINYLWFWLGWKLQLVTICYLLITWLNIAWCACPFCKNLLKLFFSSFGTKTQFNNIKLYKMRHVWKDKVSQCTSILVYYNSLSSCLCSRS